MHPILDNKPVPADVDALRNDVDFLAAYEHLPVPVGLQDKLFRFIGINQAFTDLLGYSAEELVGQPGLAIVAPESVDDVNQAQRQYLAGQVTRTKFNRVLRARSGDRLACVVEVKAIPDPSAKCRYLVVVHDADEVRRRERLLIDRAELFRLAIEQSPVPISLQDSSYRLVLVNQAYCQMTGYSEDELIGRDVLEFHDAPSQSVIRAMRHHVDSSGQFDGELKRAIIRADGTRVPYQLVLRHTMSVDGSRLIFAALQDLRHLESARHEVAEQRNWFYRAFDHAPAGILYSVPGQNEIRANRALYRMIGTHDITVLNRLVPREAAQCTEPGRQFDAGRIALRRAGEESQWLDRICSTVRHFDGSIGTVTVVTDVTREQQLRADLQSAVAQQAALLHTMDTGLAHVVGDLVVRVNPALLRLCGKSEEVLLGQPIEALFERTEQWDAVLGSGSAQGAVESQRCVVELNRDGDQPLRCEVSVRQVDPMRTDLGVLLTVRDISEWLDENDKLSRSLSDLENLIDTEPLSIAQIENGRLVRVNKAMRRLLEIGSGSLPGDQFSQMCEDSQQVADFLARCASGQDQDRLLRATLVGSKGLRSECVLHAARIGNGERNALMVMAVDLSQQARVASLAIKMQGRFEAFSSLLNDAMVVIARDSSKVLHANPAVTDVLGLDGQQVSGSSAGRLWNHLADEDRDKVLQAYRELEAGQVVSLAVLVNHPAHGALNVRLRMFIAEDGRESFVLAEDVTKNIQLEQQRLADAVKQKDGLVREVHHRIKNNLQGVAGLLQQSAIREPQLSAILGEVAGQIHAVAQVHGLQLQDEKLTPQGIVRAIADNIRHTFGHHVPLEIIETSDASPGPDWVVPELEAVPLALVINEITSNAFKHGEPGCDVKVTMAPSESGFQVIVSNAGELPADFDLATRPVSPTGLGLIRALMPKRGADLTLDAHDGQVIARLSLQAPALMLDMPGTQDDTQLRQNYV